MSNIAKSDEDTPTKNNLTDKKHLWKPPKMKQNHHQMKKILKMKIYTPDQLNKIKNKDALI